MPVNAVPGMKVWIAVMCVRSSSKPDTRPKRSAKWTSGDTMGSSRARRADDGVGPGCPPSFDETRGACIDVVGDDVREDGELVPPTLHVIVAGFGLGQLVLEMKARAG